MSYYALMFVIALLVFEDHILVGKGDNKCNNGYKLFQESCYRLSNNTAARADATDACRPGHLVDITSEEEQGFIVTLLTNPSKVKDAWFGLVKSLSWSDGSSLVHESWQEILADDRHRCFLLEKPPFTGGVYRWNDIGCEEQHKSICEYEISDNEGCRSGFIKYNRSCYQINNNTLNRTDAAAVCGAKLAHLVDITSDEEHQFVVGLLTAAGGGDAWFGLTLSEPPSWSDGSLLSQGDWYDIITNGQSVCYRLEAQGQGYVWNDDPSSSCRGLSRYVCENEVTSVSSTTSESQESTTQSTTSADESTTQSTTGDRVISASTMTTFAIPNSPNNPLETSKINAIGAIIGSLFGVVLLIVAIAAVIWFVLRQKKTNNSESQSPVKVPPVVVGTTREPEHNNPTYAIDAAGTTEDDAHQYNTVHDQQGEYTYIETNASGKVDEHIYAETAADRKSSHTSNKDSPDEGWNDNTIYVTSDDTLSAQNAEEGWADNSVYGK